MGRQVIFINVRTDTEAGDKGKLEHIASLVGQALNCTFAEGEYERWYAQLAFVFGLEVALVGRAGIGGKKVAKLVANVDERKLYTAPDGSLIEHDRVDISEYIVDLLTARTGLQWYVPTAEDRMAEGKASARFDDWLGGVGGGGWSNDDEEHFRDRHR